MVLKLLWVEGLEIMVMVLLFLYKRLLLIRVWIFLVLIFLLLMFFIWIKKVGWFWDELWVLNKNIFWDVMYVIIVRYKWVLVCFMVFILDEIWNMIFIMLYGYMYVDGLYWYGVFVFCFVVIGFYSLCNSCFMMKIFFII